MADPSIRKVDKIVFSGLAFEQNEELIRNAKMMGTIASGNLDTRTTHLLITSNRISSSEKYKVAVSRNLQIVLPEWLIDSTKRGQWLVEDHYRVPCFHDLVMSISGFGTDENDELIEMVENEEGEMNRMLKSSYNCLISKEPGGKKWFFALENQIPVVKPEWIRQCVRLKVRLPFDEYLVQEVKDEKFKYQEEEFSCSEVGVSDCFAGCVVHLGQFQPDELKVSMLLLRYGMGTRCRASDPDMTHLIIGTNNDSKQGSNIEEEMKRRGVIVVNRQWLLQSAKRQSLLDPLYFPIFTPQPLTPKLPPSESEKVQAQKTPRSTKQPIPNIFQDDILLLHTSDNCLRVAESYVNEVKARGGVALVFSSSIESQDELFDTITQLATEHYKLLRKKQLDEKLDIGDRNSINRKRPVNQLNFIVVADLVAFPSSEFDELEKRIQAACRGIALLATPQITRASFIWLHFCVRSRYANSSARCQPSQYPLFQPLSWNLKPFPSINTTSSTSSMQQKRIKFVISLSMYTDIERAVLEVLVKLMKAEFGEFNSKITHLICKRREGEKYNKALNNDWGIEVVTCDWLIHCAQYGWHQGCEEPFRLNKKQNTELDKVSTSSVQALRSNINTTSLHELKSDSHHDKQMENMRDSLDIHQNEPVSREQDRTYVLNQNNDVEKSGTSEMSIEIMDNPSGVEIDDITIQKPKEEIETSNVMDEVSELKETEESMDITVGEEEDVIDDDSFEVPSQMFTRPRPRAQVNEISSRKKGRLARPSVLLHEEEIPATPVVDHYCESQVVTYNDS